MIKRLTRREKIIFFACICVVVIFIGFNGVYKPLKSKVDIMDIQIEAEKRKLTKNQRLLRRSINVQKDYLAYINKYKQKISDEQVMSSLLDDIDGVAGDLSMRISDLKPSPVKKTDYYTKFSVSLTIDSEFIAILEFLHTLQGKPHYFDISELRFDKSSRRSSKTIKTRLELSKIFIPQSL